MLNNHSSLWNKIAVETKGNFFESRTVEYQKAKLNETLSFTDDF